MIKEKTFHTLDELNEYLAAHEGATLVNIYKTPAKYEEIGHAAAYYTCYVNVPPEQPDHPMLMRLR